MREYHIYMQRTKCVEAHFNYIIYRWLPWEYVGYVEGTKELYTCFKSKFPYSINSIDFYNSFNYFDDEYFRRDNDCWNSMDFNCSSSNNRHENYRIAMAPVGVFITFINELRQYEG